MISDMNIPVPPAETQAEIVKEIQSAEDSTELLVTKIREQVSLLQERRQALITAAVTGQLEI